jgi:oligoribonuclease (3'-5' exoribonuclease)
MSLLIMFHHGLKLDASTVIWWMAQNEAARKEFTDRTSEMVSLEVALKLFSKFIGKCDKNVSIWANSPSFDCSMVRNSYDAIGSHEMPWTYKQERDYRTIVGLCKEKLPATNKNIAHKAIHDCYNQIENLRFAMHQLRLVY